MSKINYERLQKQEKNILYITSIPMDFDNAVDYYSNEDLISVKNTFKLYNNKLLKRIWLYIW
ncbi:MAG: hypothetical protein L6V81_08535 [Clostridium sp.]|nr:MAG: hypothetical protein L6V81_08535 [Clostridium sp.]